MFILFFLRTDNLEKHEKDWRSVGISQGRQIGGRYQVRSHGKLCQRQSFQSERFSAEGWTSREGGKCTYHGVVACFGGIVAGRSLHSG